MKALLSIALLWAMGADVAARNPASRGVTEHSSVRILDLLVIGIVLALQLEQVRELLAGTNEER